MVYYKRKRRYRHERILKRKRKQAKQQKYRGTWLNNSSGMRKIDEKHPCLLKNLDYQCSAMDVFRALDQLLTSHALSGTLHDVSITRRGAAAVLKVNNAALKFLLRLGQFKLKSRMCYFSKASYHEKRRFKKYSEIKAVKPKALQMGNLGTHLESFDVQFEFKQSLTVLLVPQDKVLCIFIAKSYLLEIDFRTIHYESFHFIEQGPKDFALCLTLTEPPRAFKKDARGEEKKIMYYSRNLMEEEDAYGASRAAVSDFTKTGILGHACRYRFSFRSHKEMEEMVTQLEKFNLVKHKKHKIQEVTLVKAFRTKVDLGSWTGSARLDAQFQDIPFSICYSLQVFIASNKACLVSGNNGIIVLNAIKAALQSNINKKQIQLLLEKMEKESSAKFQRLFPIKFKEKLDELRLRKVVTPHLVTSAEDKNSFRIRRVIITPLRVVPQPIDHERGNRMLRNVSSDKEHRFLRANIASEDFTRINGLTSGMKFEDCKIAQRIESCLRDGVIIGGRRFKFLAHSNSQLKSHSCWLYDEDTDSKGGITDTIQSLRKRIGKVRENDFVGKKAARLGQAFSTTMQSLKLKQEEFIVSEDIKRNGYVFSDGVGLISMSAAKEVAESLDLLFVPSAFQVRLGGCKGMLCTWPDDHPLLQGKKVMFRNSMDKFHSDHKTLEICRFTTSHAFNLNKQLISLFSALGVTDKVFWKLYATQRSEVEKALQGDKSCMKEVLSCLYNDGIDKGYSMMSVALLMLNAGMNPLDDPFFHSLLHTVCHRQMYLLRTKLRIKVPEGVCLLGVLDEFGVLEEGEVFVSFGSKTVESGSPLSNRTVLEQTVVVGRNPSLHCGDLRALKAVDRPEFAHLVDVIVFSQKGDRPLPDMMSGGDLDGDEFFITWHKELTRAVKFTGYPPMVEKKSTHSNDFMLEAMKAVFQPDVKPIFKDTDDAIKFFVKFILCDNLGVIANAFLVWADKKSAKCPECEEIAHLHSKAVDFAKNGERANLSKKLKPKLYPDFMGKEPNVTYESEKIMGVIYRDVKNHELLMEQAEEDMDFVSIESESSLGTEDSLFDSDEERAERFAESEFFEEGFDNYLEIAMEMNKTYNGRLISLMESYGVLNEAEILSGFCAEFNSKGKNAGEKKFQVQERLNEAVTDLLHFTRKKFWDQSGLECFEEYEITMEENKRKKARELASAMYYVTYFEVEPFEHSLLSFPWIVARVLLDIREKTIDYVVLE